ncbi:MAG: succinylglutamate desuccinylase/aspartoacylase family protein [Desulfarculaceae bacterium]|jgi:predicted deacylase
MPETFHVGDIAVQLGEKKCGRLNIATRPDGTQIFLPLMVVNGAGDGPVLNVGAVCHGTEYEGSVAIKRWWRAIDPKSFSGVFLAVPVINVIAFESGTVTSWVDQVNLNRICPGKPDGSITERIAHVYLNEVVYKADLALDLHGGGSKHFLGPQVIWRDSLGDPDVIEKSLELTKACGWQHVWKGSGGWGGTITQSALKKGIPAVTVESGGGARSVPSVEDDYEKLLGNVMKAYKMIDGQPEFAPKLTIFQGSFIACNIGGFWTQTAKIYDQLKKGQEIGNIVDFYGEVVEVVKAPFDGIVSAERTFPAIYAGELTAAFAEIIQ